MKKNLLLCLLISTAYSLSAWAMEPAGVLPVGLDRGQQPSIWLETTYVEGSGSPARLPAGCRYLVVRVPGNFDDWKRAAFELKTMIVEAKARSGDLRVALDGPTRAIRRLMSHGLHAYVDGRVTTNLDAAPVADSSTLRLWWRVEGSDVTLLAKLLEAGAHGVEAVIFSDLSLSPLQRAFFDRLRGTAATDLQPQPTVHGMPREAVRFLFDPQTGRRYLAVEGSTEIRRLRFALGQEVEARLLHPSAADFDFSGRTDHQQLTLPAGGPHLFELSTDSSSSAHSSLSVEGAAIPDPNEIVVMNQVFREKEAAKVQSLEVVEALHTLGQRPGSVPVRRTYRVFERRGRPTDYVWTGMALSGVDFPDDKLRQGFIFDADQVLVEPLAIELDRTYEYSYLGEETLDGHRTWKIGFEPVAQGALPTGTVWIDQRTHAHRRLHTRQSGDRAPMAHRERTVSYEWVEDKGRRYWTWTRKEGVSILSYLGFHQPVRVTVERLHHRFNREGIDREVASIHGSEQKILRQTSDGMRWLTRRKSRPVDGDIRTQADQRVLVGGRHAYAKGHRIGLSVSHNPEPGRESTRVSPEYTYFNLGLWGSKYQGYFNAAGSLLGIARPGVIRRNWTLSFGIDSPVVYRHRELGAGLEQDVDFRRLGMSLSLAMPIRPWLSIYARYRPSRITFDRVDHADPNLVLPVDHNEQRGQVELKVDRRGFSSELMVEYAQRDQWQAWGSAPDQALERSYVKGSVRGGYSRALAGNQSLAVFASYLYGTSLDRFSKFRLGERGFRAPGYGSQVRFDEGYGVGLSYSGHFMKLFPLRLRLDYVGVRADPISGSFDHLMGAELSTVLHGPWKTDLYLGVSQGLSTSLSAADRDTTRFVAFFSRRF